MSLNYQSLREIVASNAAAIRSMVRLQPAGGAADKVFPSTYQGGIYAMERRLVDGQEVDCVVLDSVQSQANRFEEALLEAYQERILEACNGNGSLPFPVIIVDFSQHIQDFGMLRPGWLTSLEVPHRIADALFREADLKGLRFRESPEGRAFAAANIRNATALFELCPTALVFGVWDSTGAAGGLGNKFARALVSEIVGFRAVAGVRTASRIDPTGIEKCEVYEAEDGNWTIDAERARKEKDKPVLYGRNPQTRGRPSAINLGNVTPDIVRRERSNEPLPGGVTLTHAEQTTVLSLTALRRLRFPDATGNVSTDRNNAARTVLAALALAAVTHQRRQGYFLRSRCQLIPESEAPFEVVTTSSDSSSFTLTTEESHGIFAEAVEQAKKIGLPWRDQPIKLSPRNELVELIRRSREVTSAEGGE